MNWYSQAELEMRERCDKAEQQRDVAKEALSKAEEECERLGIENNDLERKLATRREVILIDGEPYRVLYEKM